MKWTVFCLLGYVVAVHCQPTEEEGHIRCPRRPICDPPCFHGYQTDANGCPSMECKCLADPCEGVVCGKGRYCKPSGCTEHPCTEKKSTCEGPMCAMPMCSNRCEHGYANNDFGCMTCNCKDAPAPKPVQVLPKLCEFKKILTQELMKKVSNGQETSEELKERFDTELNCKEDGSFYPLQCTKDRDSCWCVDDHGKEIRGTRIDDITEDRNVPDCVPHITKQVYITMVLIHDFKDIHQHLSMVKDTVGKRMSEWFEVEEKYIEVIKVLPHREEINLIRIEVVIRHDGKSDLAYLAQRFEVNIQKESNQKIPCHGGYLTVDAKSVKVKHTIKPMIEEVPDESHYTDCGRIWREHKPVIVVAGFGITVFTAVVIAFVIMACKKRRASAQFQHQRMDQYGENLAFQNDVYGHPDITKEKDLVKTLSVKKTDETKPEGEQEKY